MININIKETIVVEGKNDKIKLLSFLKCSVIITNGSALDQKTLNLIKLANDKNGVIIFTDPDQQGKKIRQTIQRFLNSECKHAFIKLEHARSNNRKKIGIEHAPISVIKNALKNVVSFHNNKPSINWDQYLELKLVGWDNSAQLRKKITDHYKMLYCNGKQLFKRLQMMGIRCEEVKKILEIND